jgi:hypothetical protein
MQYLVIGYDGTDDKAPERRLAVREAHLAGVTKMKEEGKAVFGVAILNDREQMIGLRSSSISRHAPNWTPGSRSSRT